MWHSLKNKLTASHLAVIFLTAAFLGIGSYVLLLNHNSHTTFHNLQTTANHASIFLGSFLANKEDQLTRMADSRDVLEFSTTYRELALAQYLRQFAGDFSSISYLSPKGREELHMAGSVLKDDQRDFSRDPLFNKALANPGRICYEDESALPSRRVLTMALADKARFGEDIDNVLMVEIPLAVFDHLLDSFIADDEFVIIHDRLGRILLHPKSEFLGQTVVPTFSGHGFSEQNRLGEDGYYATANIPRLRWTLVTVLPKVAYDVYPAQLRLRAFLAFLFTCLLGSFIAYQVSRKLTAPLLSLTALTQRIAAGKSTQPIAVETGDEVGVLVRSFNRMMAALKETTVSRDYVDNILQSFHECLLVVNEEGIITSANRTTFKLLGYSETELLGKSIDFILPDADLAAGIGGQQCSLLEQETNLLTKDGEKIAVLFSSSFLRDGRNDPLGAVCLAQDIRQRKADEQEKASLQAQLQQAQRLETIGTLAGGVAHDFNNILTAIIGFCQLAKRMVPEDHPAGQAMENSLAASFRAKDLVKQLLSFSRQSSQEKAPLQLAPIVKEIVKMLRATTPSTIDIKLHVDPDCHKIYGDSAQIHQLIMNLCANAVQAMEKQGTLTVSITNLRLEGGQINSNQNLKAGNHVRIQVKDTGPGIAPGILHRIFDPFFTTKDIDHGSGLGLAVAHGIVKSHDGDISISSKLGEGTIFTIILPANETKESLRSEEHAQESATGHAEHLLFLDDEPALTQLARQILSSAGYRVTATCSSEEALELFRAAPSSFDLVITDFAMPKLDGGQLAANLLAVRPDIPIVLCTGYSEDIRLQQSLQNSIRRVVLKPYTPIELTRHIRQVLDEGGTRQGASTS